MGVFVSSVFGVSEFKRVLTQDLSIQTAMSINPDLLSLSRNSELAAERVKEAKALYLPVVDLNFNFSSFNNISPMIETNAQTIVFLPATKKDVYYNTRISFMQNIYAGGRISATNKLARINISKAEIENNIIKNRVLRNVKIAFNNCLYFKEQLRYFQSLYKTNPSAQNAYKISFAKLNYEKKLLDLFNAIGLELNTIAELSGDFKPIIKNLDLAKCLILAYQFKPEFSSTQYQESIDELMVGLLSMQRYPSIYISAAQEWAGDQKIINDESNWYIAVNVNVPIFDGGALFSRIRQGKLTARETTLRRTKAEDAIKLEVHKTFMDYSFYRQKAIELKLADKKTPLNESELEIIKNLNDSYYNLEYAIGVQLDQY
jgi:outer membrane protein TolC